MMKCCLLFLFSISFVEALHRLDRTDEVDEFGITAEDRQFIVEEVADEQQQSVPKEVYKFLKKWRKQMIQQERDQKRLKCEEGSDEGEKAAKRPSQDRTSLERERRHHPKRERQGSMKEREKLHRTERRKRNEELAHLYGSKKSISEVAEPR